MIYIALAKDELHTSVCMIKKLTDTFAEPCERVVSNWSSKNQES